MKYNLITGIIYRIHNSGNADKLINIITNEGKKLSALAKSVRKTTSKKASSIELGNLVQFKTVEGYSIPIITEVKLQQEFMAWKKDYEAMLMLQLVCEIIDKFAFEEIEDARLFELLQDLLARDDLKRIEYLIAAFILKVLNITGHLPRLDICTETSEKINSENANYISGQVGYIIEGMNPLSKKVNERIYKTQRFILESDLEKSLNVSLTKEEDITMLKLHLDWLELSIEQELKSKAIVLGLLGK